MSTKYKNEGRPKIRRINKQAAALIKGLQPFNQGGKNSLLWILHDMWNTDKHKLLHIVVADVAGLMRNYTSGNRFMDRSFTGLPGKLKEGAEFRIDFPDFYEPGKMRVDLDLMVRLEFDSVSGPILRDTAHKSGGLRGRHRQAARCYAVLTRYSTSSIWTQADLFADA